MSKVKHDKCRFPRVENVFDVKYPASSDCARLRRKFREFFLISEENGRRCHMPMGTTGYIFEKEKQFTRHPFTIHPYSKFCQYWETLAIINFTISLVIRPLFISQFSWTVFMRTDYQIAAALQDLFESTDVWLRFIIGYIEKETQYVVFEYKKIFFYNIRQFEFYMDAFVSLPFDLVAYMYIRYIGPRSNVILFFSFLKIFKLFRLYRYIRHIAKLYNWTSGGLSVAFIIVIVPLIYHWLTCLFYLIVLNEEFSDPKIQRELLKESIMFRHLSVFCMITTIFYYQVGEIFQTPINSTTELFVAAFICLCVSLTNTFYVCFIVQVMGLLKTPYVQYSEMIQELRKFLSQENLPKHIHVKVEKYLEFCFQRKYFREKSILDTVSPALKLEITKFICQGLLLNPDSIFNGISEDLAECLYSHMTYEVFLQGDNIVTAGKSAKKIYFLYSGSAVIYTPTGKELLHLYEGHQFGISVFMTQSSYALTVVALEICECFVLQYNDFIKCSSINEEDIKIVLKAVNEKKNILLEVLAKEKM